MLTNDTNKEVEYHGSPLENSLRDHVVEYYPQEKQICKEVDFKEGAD